MSETLIKVEGVSKKFCRSLKKSLWYGLQDLGCEVTGRHHDGDGELRADEFWAVRDVSFELKRGECLGLIGCNGAGKTTLLRMLNGLIKPDSGRIEMRGRVSALIALGAGFNPVLTGRENIYVNGSVLGMSKKEMDNRLEEIIEFSGVESFIDAPVRTYSSGMQVRLGFAVAAHIEPDVLLIDEILAVGDIAFRNRCYTKIAELQERAAVIFVSHFPPHIGRLCNRVIYLQDGMKNLDTLDVNRGLGEYLKQSESANCEDHVRADVKSRIISINGQVPNGVLKLRKNDSLLVKWELVLPDSVPNIEINVAILDASLDKVAVCNSCHDNVILSRRNGTLQLEIMIDHLPLGGGRYYLSLLVFVAKTFEQIVWHHALCELAVESNYYTGYPIVLDGKWSVVETTGINR